VRFSVGKLRTGLTLSMSLQEVTTLHRHGGPCHILDAANWKRCQGKWHQDFEAKLRENGNVLGLDMEWVPDRCPHHDHKIALVQIAVGDTVWLLRTCQIGLPQVVQEVLLQDSVLKVVAAFDSSDKAKLATSFGLCFEGEPASYGFLDISQLARECGITGVGVKRLAGRYGYHIAKNKKISVSNWAATNLSVEQQRYAADDAYFNLLIATRLLKEEAIQTSHLTLWRNASERLATIKTELESALCNEDCSARIASHAAFWEELWEAVLSTCESSGQPKLRQAAVGGLRCKKGTSFGKLAAELGVSLMVKSLEEQRTFFAVSRHEGEAMIRPRTVSERLPPSAAEAALHWISNQKAALDEWLHLQADKNLDDVQLKGRLRLLGRWFERRGEDASAKSIFATCDASRERPLHAVAAKMLMPASDTCVAGNSHTVLHAETKLHQRQTLEGDIKKKNISDPARGVALRGIPPEWTTIDFVDFISNLLGEDDVMAEWHLFPWRKGKGQRKAVAVFEKVATAEKMLTHPKVCFMGSTILVERLVS